MKKCLIIFTIAILSIIPTLKVDAFTGNNGTEYPDKPDDGNNNYIAYYRMREYTYNLNEYKLITFSDNVTVHSRAFSGTTGSSSYYMGANLFLESTDGNSFSYKIYKYSNNSWKLESESEVTSYTEKFVFKLLYSTQDLYFRSCSGCNNYYEEETYFIYGPHENESITYKSDVIKEYLSFEYELVENENNSYYNILFSANEFNENYMYRIKFNDDGWINITNYLKNGYYNFQLLYNATLYMQVLDENNSSIEAKTFEFLDLVTKEEYYSPTASINISCSTNHETNLEQALINFKFNNYSSLYKYQYSFNDIDYIDISPSDIKNKSYSLYTSLNTSIFLRILDTTDNVLYKIFDKVTCILDSDKYYYYEFTIDDLYDSEINQLIFYTLYYENIKNRDVVPFVYFYYLGNENLPFHITYNSNVIDLSNYSISLNEKILNDISCTNLPYEFIDKNLNMQSYTSYTTFSFMPCIDLTTFLYGEQYTDFKLIVKSNIKLNIGEPIYFGGAFIPSTNKPVDDSKTFQSNFTSFFSDFRNAFNRFKNVIIEIFQNCTYFFNNSNVILQDFYMVIFGLILFLFLIRFIL